MHVFFQKWVVVVADRRRVLGGDPLEKRNSQDWVDPVDIGAIQKGANVGCLIASAKSSPVCLKIGSV